MNISISALNEAQIENIHQRTLDLLWSHGVTIHCETARETFAKHGARVEGAQVYIPANMIDEALKNAPSEFDFTSRNKEKSIKVGKNHPPALSSCSGVPIILDSTGVQRKINFGDYQKMLRLTHTSPVMNVANSGALYPTYDDPQLALYLQMYYTLTMTDLPLIGQSEGAKVSKDCVNLVRTATGLHDEIAVVAICNSLSPMAWDKTMIEGIRVFAEEGQAINISCCAMAGATAPVYLFGAVLEANAEVLAGLVYAQLVRPGTPVIYGTTSSIMFMPSMSLSLGTPEYSMISTACSQMAAYYDLPFRSGGGLTDSKCTDAQAGIESALNLFVSLNNGIDFMLQSVGVLEYYMSFSFDKWIMDEDIILRIKRLQSGIGEIPADLGEVLTEGVNDGGFLEHDSTVENFRNEHFWPMLADRQNFSAWKRENLSYENRANALAEKRFESYQEPSGAAEIRREIIRQIERMVNVDISPLL